MKFSLFFVELTSEEAQGLLAYATKYLPNADAEMSVDQSQKPRRRRRTKAEMEEARAQEQAEEAVTQRHEEEQPEPRRRRRGGSKKDNFNAESEVHQKGKEPEPRRRRRRAAPEESTVARRRKRQSEDVKSAEQDQTDEITDRDVAKAASDGAQELTPAAVRGILDQFGVSNVADLDQEQRREFIDMVEQAIEDADLDGGEE